MKQNRLRSKVVWVSSAITIAILLDQFGLFGKWGTSIEVVKNCIEGIASIFVLFGIFNDPTTKGEF